MAPSPSNALVEKIKKLLALASSPNEHEASLAAQKAHALLVKHNLDIQQVKDSQPKEYVKQAAETKIFQNTAEKFVAEILERHFFVRWVIVKTKNKNYGKNFSISTWYNRTIHLVGTPSNVEIALHIRSFLLKKFSQLWVEYRHKTGCFANQQQGYYQGLQLGLDKKLTSQRYKIEQERGLVLVGDKDLNDLMDKMAKAGGHYKVDADQETLRDGFEDGKKIEIQQGLTASAENSGLKLEHKKNLFDNK